MALYAAYGSNMDAAQMAMRCPHSPQAGVGWLDGWRLTFGGEDIGWEGALATVVEDAGSRVFVVLYEVSALDERALDRWDGATLGYYSKLRVRVATLERDAVAWLYVLNDYEGGLPSARYLGIMADAAEAAGAPADYVTWLRTRPCRSVGMLTRGLAGTTARQPAPAAPCGTRPGAASGQAPLPSPPGQPACLISPPA